MHEVRHVLRRIYGDRLDLRFENRPERIAGRRIAASRLIFIRRDTHQQVPFCIIRKQLYFLSHRIKIVLKCSHLDLKLTSRVNCNVVNISRCIKKSVSYYD